MALIPRETARTLDLQAGPCDSGRFAARLFTRFHEILAAITFDRGQLTQISRCSFDGALVLTKQGQAGRKMFIRMIGVFEVRDDAGEDRTPRGAKARALPAMLACTLIIALSAPLAGGGGCGRIVGRNRPRAVCARH